MEESKANWRALPGETRDFYMRGKGAGAPPVCCPWCNRASEEWGWNPQYTDYEKIVEDFINEARTNPELYGLRK